MSDAQTPPTQPSDGYGGMAPMGDTPGPAVPVTRPPAMDTAMRLMKVGAAWSLIQIIFVFVFSSQIREAIERSSAKATKPLTPDQIDAAVTVGKVTGVAGGLLAAALWFWMSVANGKGRSWARIVSTVLGALSLLSFFAGLVQPSSALARVSALITVIIGSAALFLMYRRESSEFYAASSRRR